MKDFIGHELAIGDHLVMVNPVYREMTIAKIISFTAAGSAQTIYTTKSGKATVKKLVQSCQVVKLDGDVALSLVLDGTIDIAPLRERRCAANVRNGYGDYVEIVVDITGNILYNVCILSN